MRVVNRGRGLSRGAGWAGGDRILVKGTADGAEYRCGLEGVVGDVASKAQEAWEFGFFHGGDLEMNHLILRNAEERSGVTLGFRGGIRGHFRFGSCGTGAAAGQRESGSE